MHFALILTALWCATLGDAYIAGHRFKITKLNHKIACFPRPQSRGCAIVSTRQDLSEATTPPPNKWFPKLAVEFTALLGLYGFHLTVLSQHVAVIGNRFVVGYDSCAGMAVAAGYGVRRAAIRRKQQKQHPPWMLPSFDAGNKSACIRFRITSLITIAALVKTYFQTGYFSLFWEDQLYMMSAAGWPLTVPIFRALQVLAGHLSWVIIGSAILWKVPRPPAFFARSKETSKYQWFQASFHDGWLWWTIGGYFVSSWLFNVADWMNALFLPPQVLQNAAESVVAQLVQPEHNDKWASLIGYIAPCVSAPVWEELLYRGFLLAALSSMTGSFVVSSLLQAVIFSAHHMSVTAALPLAVLGLTWSVLYTQSRNLMTVIVVHSMWNSRVFLGSWFGL